MGALESPDSDSPLNGHSPVPCEACQRRKVKCVMGDDDDSCISCQVNSVDCSLVDSPQSRKRKLNGDHEENRSKRG